ncbi:MAG: hypothetical protein VKI82_01080 [Leptolyngbya sp.]|nr:hypothetical protein [Leptolyngbya sp.]
MTRSQFTLWTQPQTYLLLLGIALGYGGLLWLAGPKPVALLGGGGISVAMLGSWALGFRPTETQDSSGNLLNSEVFRRQIDPLSQRVPPASQPTWTEAQTWAVASQRFAVRICEREPMLQGDILEALHTVMALSQQVAEGLAVIPQIETPTYRQLTQQRIEASRERLRETHDQLQQLQDQVALASLDSDTPSGDLPQGLQTLIVANKHILEDAPPT